MLCMKIAVQQPFESIITSLFFFNTTLFAQGYYRRYYATILLYCPYYLNRVTNLCLNYAPLPRHEPDKEKTPIRIRKGKGPQERSPWMSDH